MEDFLEFDLETLQAKSPRIIREACEKEARTRGTDPQPAIKLEKNLSLLDTRLQNGLHLLLKKLQT